MATHYETLDVAKSADQAEIRRAYLAAARRWHPDRVVDVSPTESAKAEAEIRKVNEAWAVLGDVEKRKIYDRQLSGRAPGSTDGLADGIRTDDGIVRIDPRLLDPSYVAARRHAQIEEISNRSSVVLRVAPVVAVLGLLAAIFVFTAYARDSDAAASTTTMAGPSLGAGVEAGSCVSILTGPALQPRPCDSSADYQVVGARLPDGECVLGTVVDLELLNGAIVCLGAVG